MRHGELGEPFLQTSATERQGRPLDTHALKARAPTAIGPRPALLLGMCDTVTRFQAEHSHDALPQHREAKAHQMAGTGAVAPAPRDCRAGGRSDVTYSHFTRQLQSISS